MSHVIQLSTIPEKVVDIGPLLQEFTEEQLFQFCARNREWRIERTAQGGDLIIMPPTGGKTGLMNAELRAQLRAWAKQDGSGEAFDSFTGFILPNGVERSPNASWVERARWESLTEEQKSRFPPLCPDFIVELRSPTDSLDKLRQKLLEYTDNGTRLAWIIDPLERRVYVYRASGEIETLINPTTVSAAPEPGFALDAASLWR